MSYRSFKHLLGETSLERKCRFIFGFGILVLVTGSFFYYGSKTETLVKQQTTQTARMLINPTLKDIHYKTLGNELFEDVLNPLWEELKPIGDLPEYTGYVLNPYSTKKTKKQPSDAFETAALERFLLAASKNPSGETSQNVSMPEIRPTSSPTARRRGSNARSASVKVRKTFNISRPWFSNRRV